MLLEKRIHSFVSLGRFLETFTQQNTETKPHGIKPRLSERFDHLINTVKNSNPWFDEYNVRKAIAGICRYLSEDKMEKWLATYPQLQNSISPKKVAVIMAGNIPMVGFHDLLCVLISGHICIAKLSSKDDTLMKHIAEILYDIEPAWKNRIIFETNRLTDFDAVIATGSDNSSRYFEYYFGKYPHIIRKNRNSVAIVSGQESDEAYRRLADDIFLFYGLGCRNVSKIYLHKKIKMADIIPHFEHYSFIRNHHKYANNYEYRKAIYLMNKKTHLDNGFAIFKEDTGISSPIGVLYYQYFDEIGQVENELMARKNAIQCVASQKSLHQIGVQQVKYGLTQQPEVWDYADNIDTMKFLLELK